MSRARNLSDITVITEDNGNIGIGTSDPDYTLHAYNPTTNVVGKFESGDDEAWIAITDVSSDYYGTLLGRKNSENVLFKVADESVTTRFEVKQDGYINATSANQVRLSLGSTGSAGTNTANWVRGNGGHLQFNSATDGFDWEVGGTNRMALSAAGELTMSNAPSFAASRTAGHVGAGTYVVYNMVRHNKGGHYDSSNGRFTAPVTGSYYIGLQTMVENDATYTNKYYEIRVNNATYSRAYSSNTAAHHHLWPWHGVISLNAGDYVSVYVYNLTLYGTGDTHSHFSGHLLS